MDKYKVVPGCFPALGLGFDLQNVEVGRTYEC